VLSELARLKLQANGGLLFAQLHDMAQTGHRAAECCSCERTGKLCEVSNVKNALVKCVH